MPGALDQVVKSVLAAEAVINHCGMGWLSSHQTRHAGTASTWQWIGVNQTRWNSIYMAVDWTEPDTLEQHLHGSGLDRTRHAGTASTWQWIGPNQTRWNSIYMAVDWTEPDTLEQHLHGSGLDRTRHAGTASTWRWIGLNQTRWNSIYMAVDRLVRISSEKGEDAHDLLFNELRLPR